MGTLRAQTAETIHIVDACCTLATGIGGTLINVNVTSLPCREGKISVKSKMLREETQNYERYCVDTCHLYRL